MSARPSPLRVRGFALPAAVFLITVLAAVAGVLINMTGGAEATSLLALQSARAQQAAASGIAWAARSALVGGACAGASFSSSATGLNGYTITTTCSARAVTEGATTYTVYSLSATAIAGAAATGDRASRTLVATVTTAP